MELQELKQFVAQEMRSLREGKTTIEKSKIQTGLASQCRLIIEMEHKMAKTILRTPNITDILKKVQDGTYSKKEEQ